LNSSNPGAAPLSALPEHLGLAALLRLHLAGADLGPLLEALIQRATENPHDACSLLDAGIIFQFRNAQDLALNLQQEALKLRRHFCLPATRLVKLRLLALMAPGDLMSNVPIECLLEDSDIELNIFYATGVDDDLSEIPEHDALFVAISETEANRPILGAWLPVLAEWPRPVINNPFHIERVARDTAARLLHDLPGVLMPPTWRVGRAELEQITVDYPARNGFPEGIDFPLIVRPVDSHAGHDLNKIDTPAQLLENLAAMPGEELFVAPFVDYSGSDGLFRKYRVVLIDGQPFACHMGISDHWMIHYLNAGMAEDPEKRAEEARFMATFEQEFALRQGAALAEIHRCIDLEYLGIDCAETLDGRLLVFEIDHAMVVHAMDPIEVYPYKQATMHKLFGAFRAMIFRKAGVPMAALAE